MEDVQHTTDEVYKPSGALKFVFSNKSWGINTKKCPYEAEIVPTALGYKSEEVSV